jgi:hypothetical protein
VSQLTKDFGDANLCTPDGEEEQKRRGRGALPRGASRSDARGMPPWLQVQNQPEHRRLFRRLRFGNHVQQSSAIGRIDLLSLSFGEHSEGGRHVLHPIRMTLPDQDLISGLDLADCWKC